MARGGEEPFWSFRTRKRPKGEQDTIPADRFREPGSLTTQNRNRVNMKEETDISTCRVCDKLLVRKFVGKFDDKNKKYVDEGGRLWNGRTCPRCHADRSRNNMKRLRKYGKTGDHLQAGASGTFDPGA